MYYTKNNYQAQDVIRFAAEIEGFKLPEKLSEHQNYIAISSLINRGRIYGLNGQHNAVAAALCARECENVFCRVTNGTLNKGRAPFELSFFSPTRRLPRFIPNGNNKADYLVYMAFDPIMNNGGSWRLTFSCAYDVESWVIGNQCALFDVPFAVFRDKFTAILAESTPYRDLPKASPEMALRRALKHAHSFALKMGRKL